MEEKMKPRSACCPHSAPRHMAGVALVSLLSVTPAFAQGEGKRVALVIGNNDYTGVTALAQRRQRRAPDRKGAERSQFPHRSSSRTPPRTTWKTRSPNSSANWARTTPRSSSMPATACRSRMKICWCRSISRWPIRRSVPKRDAFPSASGWTSSAAATRKSASSSWMPAAATRSPTVCA